MTTKQCTCNMCKSPSEDLIWHVAKAIHATRYEIDPDGSVQSWTNLHKLARNWYYVLASAAIAAMKE